MPEERRWFTLACAECFGSVPQRAAVSHSLLIVEILTELPVAVASVLTCKRATGRFSFLFFSVFSLLFNSCGSDRLSQPGEIIDIFKVTRKMSSWNDAVAAQHLSVTSVRIDADYVQLSNVLVETYFGSNSKCAILDFSCYSS